MTINKNEKCCGCGACQQICPKEAIKMERNEKGFLYPNLDSNKCISCGLCEKVCAFGEKITSNYQKKVYAAKLKKQRDKSQSGGAFSAFGKMFIEKNAIVYGVSMKNLGEAEYTRVDNMEDFAKIKKSKYIQANPNHLHNKIREDLKQNRIVFVSGTPCFIHSVKSFIKNSSIKSDNLYTCDLICHGVPSPKVYKDYLLWLSKKFGNIKEFDFRDKNIKGWREHFESFDSSLGKYSSKNYVNTFYSHLTIRESCYVCPYSKFERVSDITIGDYWSINKKAPFFDDDKGCSCIIINTDKGKEIWDNSKHYLKYKSTEIFDCLQPNLKHPTKKPKEYDVFWKDYGENGFLYCAKKYCNFNENFYFDKEKLILKNKILYPIKRMKVILKYCLKRID